MKEDTKSTSHLDKYCFSNKQVFFVGDIALNCNSYHTSLLIWIEGEEWTYEIAL